MVEKKQQGKSNKNKRKIFIVDDHPVFRQGLADLINQEQDLLVCDQAEDGPQALKAIRALRPDMVVVDITLKETSGLELIKDLKVHYPNLPVLTLSMHEESLYAERTLRAGAKGYITKREASDRVIAAIRKVLSGGVYISNGMAAKLVSRLIGSGPEAGASATDRLSDRELEVFRLIGQGHGSLQIAEKLCLSVKTIETYRAHIKEKLNLANAAELRRYAIQWVNSPSAS